MDYSEKQKDKSIIEKSYFSLMNVSFKIENDDIDDISEELQKNPYLTKDYVP